MNTTENITNFLELGEIVQHDGYTMQEAGTIKLGRTSYEVKIQELEAHDDFQGSTVTWLHGPRGATYTLEPVSMLKGDGVFRIMSFKSGSFLRVKGNEVRVVMLGNIIEVL